MQNLYVLLHLALELTDLLLAQLVYTRRELEQQWVHNRLRTPPASLDRSTSNSSSFSRSNNRRVPQCPFTSPPPPRTIPIIYQQLVLLRQQRQGGERRRPRVSRGPSPLPAAIPVLQVNDLPVPDTPPSNQPTFPRLSRPLSPSPHPFGFASHPDLSWDPHGFHGFHVWRPRNLHHFMSDFVTDTPEDATPGPGLTIRGASAGQEAMYLGETALIQSHRIQVWDFSKFKIPKIGNVKENIVVAECKIHNDASVDVSRDNKILVALLPNGRYNSTTMLGVYSLEWSSLGQCLYMTSFEQNAVSVSLSPTNRHLLVGLATRRMVPSDHTIIAQIFYLDGAHPIPNKEVGIKGRLRHARNIEQCRNHSSLSVNCIRWLPTPGQGFVYGTNSGFLRILRSHPPVYEKYKSFVYGTVRFTVPATWCLTVVHSHIGGGEEGKTARRNNAGSPKLKILMPSCISLGGQKCRPQAMLLKDDTSSNAADGYCCGPFRIKRELDRLVALLALVSRSDRLMALKGLKNPGRRSTISDKAPPQMDLLMTLGICDPGIDGRASGRGYPGRTN
uniref:Activating molecule in BECN1-regulated autophagy protein 1 n=1 Tax=Timema douglasi TaxID=61478 RepID=A0A7R8VG64_TIMDO|nr:unnamed protein product [Timema douglasi]